MLDNLKCLFGFHIWGYWIRGVPVIQSSRVSKQGVRTCAICNKSQRLVEQKWVSEKRVEVV